MRFHTNLPVNDIDETVAFYRILFDAEPVKTKIDYAKFLPAGGGLNISFHQDAAGAGALTGLHLGFELPDRASLDRVHDRLAKAGLISVPRETSVCCYANQDKLWVTDPNGYAWELYYLIADTEQKIAADTSCCATSEQPEPAAASTGCC